MSLVDGNAGNKINLTDHIVIDVIRKCTIKIFCCRLRETQNVTPSGKIILSLWNFTVKPHEILEHMYFSVVPLLAVGMFWVIEFNTFKFSQLNFLKNIERQILRAGYKTKHLDGSYVFIL